MDLRMRRKKQKDSKIRGVNDENKVRCQTDYLEEK